MNTGLLAAFLAVSFGCALAAQAPAELGPEHAIFRRAVANMEAKGSEWRFIPAVCTCPPLMREQVGVAIGTWQRNSPDGLSDLVSVSVYAIKTSNAASRYMQVRRSGRQLPDGWTLQRTGFAVDAYAAVYKDARRYGLTFRKGRFIVDVNGGNEAEVETFARPVLDAVSLIA
jgi:hypothetical protein